MTLREWSLLAIRLHLHIIPSNRKVCISYSLLIIIIFEFMFKIKKIQVGNLSHTRPVRFFKQILNLTNFYQVVSEQSTKDLKNRFFVFSPIEAVLKDFQKRCC